MRAVRPQLNAETVTIAESQHEYLTLVGALVKNKLYGSKRQDGVNTTVLCFRPSDEERARLAAGEDIYVSLLTFGGSLQPIIVSCGKEETAQIFEIEVEA